MAETANPETPAPAGAVLRDAVETRRLPQLAPQPGGGKRTKQLALLRRSLKLADTDPRQGLEIAKKALALDPEFSRAQHIAGLMHDKLGMLSQALEHYEAAWKLDPTDNELYQNLGLAAWKLDMLDAAEKFFRIGLKREPGRTDYIVNLSGVLRDKSRFDDAMEMLRQAIYADPSNHVLWNVLGTVMLEAGEPGQAETFYREAINQKPDFARAWHNLAYALDMLGRTDEALEACDRSLENPASAEDEAYTRHCLSFTLLSAGRLEEGWEAYDIRIQPAFKQSTVFLIPAPRWDRQAESLAGKRVLLVGEQGLGDEVLFANAARDFARAVGPYGRLMIAVERRLVPLFQRAFPEATVGPHNTFTAEARKFRSVPWVEEQGGVDLWAPSGDAPCVFRRTLDDFPKEPGFLPPAPERVAQMRAQLDALGPGLKVGVVWKSMLMTASRAKYFSPFAQWAPVMRTPGVTFVNLQYGDVEADLAHTKREFGVEIAQIEGLDVRDDLDGVAALGAALDITIGPMTASTNLAAAAGGEVWLLAYANHWPGLGTGAMPWYPQARTISPPEWGKWAPAMEQAAADLAARAGGKSGNAAAA